MDNQAGAVHLRTEMDNQDGAVHLRTEVDNQDGAVQLNLCLHVSAVRTGECVCA